MSQDIDPERLDFTLQDETNPGVNAGRVLAVVEADLLVVIHERIDHDLACVERRTLKPIEAGAEQAVTTGNAAFAVCSNLCRASFIERTAKKLSAVRAEKVL
jgi:hypothetical protein